MNQFLLAAATDTTGPGDLVKWVLASVGLVLFLGAVAQFVRRSADKGTIVSLKDSVGAVQIENGILKQQVQSMGERLTKVENENAVLRSAVSQKEEIKELQATLESHHTDSMKVLRSIERKVGPNE